ncbi:hypothetical protein [uncultured Microbulbifer sp.]|uniref:hypothetical protein n=1 Tax=uncultured Microbulbifer sp. TaxID=348147 RepID=UPI00260C83F7|nr:hypothetical protein [uncultured Microbulbifer sp.]
MGIKNSFFILLAALAIAAHTPLTWTDDLHERKATQRCLKTCKEIYYNCIRDNQKAQNSCVIDKMACDNVCHDSNKNEFYDDENETE